MKNLLTIFPVLIFASRLWAQESALPYDKIPPQAKEYSAGTVAARLIDGLGFRFYWATDGLRESDLTFRPGKDARTTVETIQHIYEMSAMIRNATTQTVNMPGQSPPLTFIEMRKAALENFKIASDILRKSTDEELSKYTLKYKQGEQLMEHPFWNMINGPIADCLWHVGQVVSFRRSSGNPFSEKVNVFTGTVAN